MVGHPGHDPRVHRLQHQCPQPTHEHRAVGVDPPGHTFGPEQPGVALQRQAQVTDLTVSDHHATHGNSQLASRRGDHAIHGSAGEVQAHQRKPGEVGKSGCGGHMTTIRRRCGSGVAGVVDAGGTGVVRYINKYLGDEWGKPVKIRRCPAAVGRSEGGVCAGFAATSRNARRRPAPPSAVEDCGRGARCASGESGGLLGSGGPIRGSSRDHSPVDPPPAPTTVVGPCSGARVGGGDAGDRRLGGSVARRSVARCGHRRARSRAPKPLPEWSTSPLLWTRVYCRDRLGVPRRCA